MSTRTTTLAHALIAPTSRVERVLHPSQVLRVLLAIVGGVLFIAFSARVSFYLPISPVPVTGQTFAVLLIGVTLGARLGAATVLLYLAEGAAGWPVLAGGAAGLPYMLGPTGGFLIGFVPAAWIAGALAERGWDRRPLTTLAAMSIATAALFLCGALWLGPIVGWSRVVGAGIIPFLPGAIIKIGAASLLLPSIWRLLSGVSPVHRRYRL